MAENESTDPSIAEADRRVERAKASLLARVEVLKHKLGDAKHQLDLGSHIAKHPLPAIGIAFAVGVLAALHGAPRAQPREPGEHSLTGGGGRSLTGVGLSALAAFGLRLVRDLALAQLGNAAKEWWIEQGHRGSRGAADLEPFLEH